MTATIPRPADRDDWLELRRPYFNASAAATLFGEHPFVSLAGIVRSKLEHEAAEENDAMRRGRHLEAAVAAWWEEEHGLALYEPDVLYANWPILATLDRRIVGNDTDAVEIKTTAKYVSRPERYWWWQCQAQLYAAALERVHLVVLDASMRLQTFVIERDEEGIRTLADRAHDVMHHVSAGRWPPFVPEQEVQRHTDNVVELDGQEVADFKEWLEVRDQIASLEQIEAALKINLIEALGDAQAATIDGRTVLVYRSHTRSNIDLGRLRAEHPDLVAELAVEQLVRVLRPARST